MIVSIDQNFGQVTETGTLNISLAQLLNRPIFEEMD